MFPSRQVESTVEPLLQPWLFQVQPYPEESFGHFLGRFRRANHLSSAYLSTLLKQRPYAVSYWETPSRRRQPDAAALQHLSQLTGVAVARLSTMRSPQSVQIHLLTRLCAYCYTESPHHRLSWQVAAHPHCDVHQRRLLEVCPDCRSIFQLPSRWRCGECDRCHFPFHQMRMSQKKISSPV